MLDVELAVALRSVEVARPGAPLVGDDVLDADKGFIRVAEIAFEPQRVAFLLEAQRDIQSRLEGDGWRVCTA